MAPRIVYRKGCNGSRNLKTEPGTQQKTKHGVNKDTSKVKKRSHGKKPKPRLGRTRSKYNPNKLQEQHQQTHISSSLGGDGRIVRIKLRDNGTRPHERHVDLRTDDELSEVMKLFMLDREVREARFLYDGVPVQMGDTFDSLEMQNGDTIDVFYRSMGGGP
ncbi:MAG: hypothetical protein M1820_008590 [Bogoriella megaspora]|nr:MAG: hypothetical protein M1820_008590 [Bogoriella megaspora]